LGTIAARRALRSRWSTGISLRALRSTGARGSLRARRPRRPDRSLWSFRTRWPLGADRDGVDEFSKPVQLCSHLSRGPGRVVGREIGIEWHGDGGVGSASFAVLLRRMHGWL
jgi:hypothetical protein